MPKSASPRPSRHTAPRQSNRNLGQTTLRRKRRCTDPMASYDGLPAPVRRWMAQAALPWSPTSVRRIWSKSRAKGLCDEEALLSLSRAEAQTLAREKTSPVSNLTPIA